MALNEQRCTPCEIGTRPMTPERARTLLRAIPQWSLKDYAIERSFVFKDFKAAIAFVNRVADLAEEQQHHPDIYISYNKVRLELYTHKIGGLSQNDFILAAKIDRAETPA